MLEHKLRYMDLIGQMVRASPADEVDDVDELGPDGKARTHLSAAARGELLKMEDALGAQLLAWWRLLGVIKARETGGGGDEGKKKKERSGIFGRIGGRQHKKGANLGLDDKQAEELASTVSSTKKGTATLLAGKEAGYVHAVAAFSVERVTVQLRAVGATADALRIELGGVEVMRRSSLHRGAIVELGMREFAVVGTAAKEVPLLRVSSEAPAVAPAPAPAPATTTLSTVTEAPSTEEGASFQAPAAAAATPAKSAPRRDSSPSRRKVASLFSSRKQKGTSSARGEPPPAAATTTTAPTATAAAAAPAAAAAAADGGGKPSWHEAARVVRVRMFKADADCTLPNELQVEVAHVGSTYDAAAWGRARDYFAPAEDVQLGSAVSSTATIRKGYPKLLRVIAGMLKQPWCGRRRRLEPAGQRRSSQLPLSPPAPRAPLLPQVDAREGDHRRVPHVALGVRRPPRLPRLRFPDGRRHPPPRQP